MVLRRKCSIQIVARRVVGGQERHHHGVQSGRGLERNLKVPSQRRRVLRAGRSGTAAVPLGVPIEQLHALAVEQEFQLLAADFAERIGVAHVALADGRDLDGVVAVGGKLMLHDHSAASAEGHAFNVIVLRGVFGDAVRWSATGVLTSPDRQAADLARGRRVAFEQRRRKRQRAGDVVEAAR